jgi:hypothetical protein
MAGEDAYELESMSDDEVEDLIREALDEYSELDPSDLEIRVTDGQVSIGGRVGTDAEYQVVEQVLSEVIGIEEISNDIVVDASARTQQDDAADVANAELYGTPRGQRGGANRTEDSAAHLLDDTGAEQFGTSDMGEAIERGYSYNPPDTPGRERNRKAGDL